MPYDSNYVQELYGNSWIFCTIYNYLCVYLYHEIVNHYIISRVYHVADVPVQKGSPKTECKPTERYAINTVLLINSPKILQLLLNRISRFSHEEN